MRVFLTGATGFAGSHLLDDLVAEGHQVYALVHEASGHQGLPSHPSVHAVAGDLLDGTRLARTVAEVGPEVVYHLAGLASVGRSWDDPARWLAVNAGGTANLLQAAVAAGRPRVVVVTSADIYGQLRPDMLPITEAQTPAPNHPYGISKWAAAQFVPLYWRAHRLPVIEARPFNHIGPRQSKGFVVTDFASQLAAIALGQAPPSIAVGNLDAQRDFTDVRDVVRAYRLLAECGRPGESYLVCSGQPIAIHYILNTLIELTGASVEVSYDPERMRPSDTPCVYGSFAKINAHTNWRPQIHLRQSLQDALDEWMRRLLP